MLAFLRRIIHTTVRNPSFLHVWLSSLFVISLLGGCDNPSGVGLDLIDEEGGAPIRVTLPSESVSLAQFEKITGAIRSATAFTGQVSSTLAGEVDDPVFGRRQAAGYVDFRLTTPDPDISGSAITLAELHLAQTYLYGDTLAETTLIVLGIPTAWDATDATADQEFTVGDEITRITYRPTDSLIVVPLPDTWFQANDATLRSDDFNTLFHGFHLRTENASAVNGFSATGSVFRIGNAADTLDLVVESVFTHIEAEEPASPFPDDLFLVQDGSGQTLSLEFEHPGAEYGQAVLNRASLRIQADTQAMQAGKPEHFVRPIIQQINLYGVTAEGTRDLLQPALLDSLGQYTFVSTGFATGPTLAGAFQNQLIGEGTYQQFVLLPPESSNTLNVSLLYGSTGDARAPEAILTLIPPN